MESKSENEERPNLEQCLHQDATHYAVNYSHGRKTNEVRKPVYCILHTFSQHVYGEKKCSYMQAVHDRTEDFTKKR